jgi:hypothetical protein
VHCLSWVRLSSLTLEFLHMSPFYKGDAAFFAAGGLLVSTRPPIVPLAKGDKVQRPQAPSVTLKG